MFSVHWNSPINDGWLIWIFANFIEAVVVFKCSLWIWPIFFNCQKYAVAMKILKCNEMDKKQYLWTVVNIYCVWRWNTVENMQYRANFRGSLCKFVINFSFAQCSFSILIWVFTNQIIWFNKFQMNYSPYISCIWSKHIISMNRCIYNIERWKQLHFNIVSTIPFIHLVFTS